MKIVNFVCNAWDAWLDRLDSRFLIHDLTGADGGTKYEMIEERKDAEARIAARAKRRSGASRYRAS